MSGEEKQHNSSHHGDPERSQSSPRLLAEPSLCSLTPLQSSCAASHGVGWAHVDHLGSQKHAHTHTNKLKSSLEKPVGPLVSSNPLSSIIQRFSPVLLFFLKLPIRPSIMISPPLRHPVSLTWRVTLASDKGYSPWGQIICHILIT